jgi:hypothetical protein
MKSLRISWHAFCTYEVITESLPVRIAYKFSNSKLEHV